MNFNSKQLSMIAGITFSMYAIWRCYTIIREITSGTPISMVATLIAVSSVAISIAFIVNLSIKIKFYTFALLTVFHLFYTSVWISSFINSTVAFNSLFVVVARVLITLIVYVSMTVALGIYMKDQKAGMTLHLIPLIFSAIGILWVLVLVLVLGNDFVQNNSMYLIEQLTLEVIVFGFQLFAYLSIKQSVSMSIHQNQLDSSN